FAPAQRRRIYVGYSCGNCIDCCFENMRQTHKRQIGVKFSDPDFFFLSDLSDTWYGRKNRHQVCGTGKDEIFTSLCRKGQIAGELNRISGVLVCVDQQRLLGNWTTVPFRVRTVKTIDWPPLVFGEAARIISDLQQAHAEIDVRLGEVRLKLNGALKTINSLVRLTLLAGDESETVVCLSVFVFGFDDLRKASARILELFCVAERDSQMISRVGKFRLEGDALAIGSNRIVKLALLVELVTALKMKAGRPCQLLR